MNKKLFLAGALIMLMGFAFAYEQPLSAFDFGGLNNITNSTTLCKELTITPPQQALAEKGAGILSLNAEFTGDVNDSTYISVSVNGGEEKKYWHESFNCSDQCWSRVFIPELTQGTTKINICAVLGGASAGINVTQNSFVGIYDTPVLSIKNSAPPAIHLGERAKMSIIIANTGTKQASVFVQFIHPDTRAKIPITSFDIVEGDSSAATTIAPGETKQFIYYIKPSVVSSYNLPSAALFFKNIFGEDETLLSTHPFMAVTEQKQVDAALVSVSEQDPRTFKAIIKNNYSEQFSGTITIAPQTAFNEYTQDITVAPNSEKEILFTSNPLQNGKYTFFATIRDTNQIYYSNKILVEVTQSQVPFQVILAIAGIIIGAIIFGWIYFVKVK